MALNIGPRRRPGGATPGKPPGSAAGGAYGLIGSLAMRARLSRRVAAKAPARQLSKSGRDARDVDPIARGRAQPRPGRNQVWTAANDRPPGDEFGSGRERGSDRR